MIEDIYCALAACSDLRFFSDSNKMALFLLRIIVPLILISPVVKLL